jgi:hypothetical protein
MYRDLADVVYVLRQCICKLKPATGLRPTPRGDRPKSIAVIQYTAIEGRKLTPVVTKESNRKGKQNPAIERQETAQHLIVSAPIPLHSMVPPV